MSAGTAKHWTPLADRERRAARTIRLVRLLALLTLSIALYIASNADAAQPSNATMSATQ